MQDTAGEKEVGWPPPAAMAACWGWWWWWNTPTSQACSINNSINNRDAAQCIHTTLTLIYEREKGSNCCMKPDVHAWPAQFELLQQLHSG